MKFIVLTGAIALTSLQQGRADPEIHLIPSGYVGLVTIAFDDANGEAAASEDGARLYRIPVDGILLTQQAPNIGMGPVWKFYLIGSDGERTPVPRIWASSVADTPENWAYPDIEIFYPVRGKVQAGRIPCDIQFDQYFVGTRAQLLSRIESTRIESTDHARIAAVLEKRFVCRNPQF